MTAQEEADAVECLTCMIAGTFTKAYRLASNGTTLDAILIDYDIQAAAAQQHEAVNTCGRNVIKAAVCAVEDRIPFAIAFVYLMARVDAYVDELLQQLQ